MKTLSTLIVLWLMPAFFAPTSGDKPVIVDRVIDGDTFVTATGERIRLYGIDAPEMDQPYGPEAKAVLTDLLDGPVTIDRVTKDRYGRTIATAKGRGREIASEMIAAGAAWMYRKYCSRPLCVNLRRLEAKSKRLRKGLWGSESKTSSAVGMAAVNKEDTIGEKDNDKNGNVIHPDRLMFKQAEKNGHPGIQVLMSLTEQQLDDLFQFIFGLIEWEIKFGMGQIDWDPDDDDEDEPDLYWFQHIQNVYAEVNKGCYMCDDSIDANETQYMEKEGQWLCGTCQMKLANILDFHGVEQKKKAEIAPLGAAREVQTIRKGE